MFQEREEWYLPFCPLVLKKIDYNVDMLNNWTYNQLMPYNRDDDGWCVCMSVCIS